MDYTKLLNELNQASLFDLYRLQVAIGKEMENPERINAIKKKLHIGMELSYFHYAENRSVKAKLLECRPKTVVVLDDERQQPLVIAYYMLNLEGTDTSIHEVPDSLTANHLKVGDRVGFKKNGKEIAGVIKRLNHKTVTLNTTSGHQWRVAYSYLFRIHDAELAVYEISQ